MRVVNLDTCEMHVASMLIITPGDFRKMIDAQFQKLREHPLSTTMAGFQAVKLRLETEGDVDPQDFTIGVMCGIGMALCSSDPVYKNIVANLYKMSKREAEKIKREEDENE